MAAIPKLNGIARATSSVALAQEAMQVFEFEANQVRIIHIDGEPWFVAIDVANILGFADSNKMTRLLDDDEKQTRHNMAGLTGSRNTSVPLINEPGLYSAILKSRKDAAKRFKRWVTHDVLSTIRKTGSYTLTQKQPPSTTLALPQNYEEALEHLLVKVKENRKLNHQLEEAKPKLEVYEGVMNSEGLFTIAEAAKVLGTGQRKLFELLRDERILMRDNLPYQRYLDNGYFKVKETFYKADGELNLHKQSFLTQKGVEWLYTKFFKDKTLPTQRFLLGIEG